ncbi:anti-sigma 24 factor [Pseudoalteromonas luteoviolacea]|uniref:Anti-sigma 24 factor n=1 Tax=Pseudoalteromonas luteoviolacea TaxID=43657 RepID=A0A1C0TLY2_9GAMM|nr:RseA family anti-sigma factor [Pseudoalteromonas luteoviolacea]MBQ4812360.1 anti-sigma 24 factor [Pseudoalteromonas luteoviolacea]OCQ19904.1 anti-sigma 24 factor [Pseudoalteromonas luteoviolacea]
MTQSKFNVNNEEVTSEILDGECALNGSNQAQLDAHKFARYALIGDVMRQKEQSTACIDITSSVAAALADEPVYTATDNTAVKQKDDEKVVQMSFWRRPISQVAIAASVALCTVVGVNNFMPQNAVDTHSPVLQSTPLTGSVAPVSFSSEQPALQSAEQGLRELQKQRIGALVLEHQRQSRMAHALSQNTAQADKEQQEEK